MIDQKTESVGYKVKHGTGDQSAHGNWSHGAGAGKELSRESMKGIVKTGTVDEHTSLANHIANAISSDSGSVGVAMQDKTSRILSTMHTFKAMVPGAKNTLKKAGFSFKTFPRGIGQEVNWSASHLIDKTRITVDPPQLTTRFRKGQSGQIHITTTL